MHRIHNGSTAIAVEDEGSGPAVLLMHGWPDTRELWRHQVPALVDAGYRVVACDLRGAGDSDRPAPVEDYAIPLLLTDQLAVLDHLGIEQAHVVGHDWGAAIGFVLAALAPERVASLTALSVGHPVSVQGAGFEQRQKSWYMLLFQFEEVAETWISQDDFARFRAWSQHPDIDGVVERLREPGAITAGLNLYRANLAPATLVQPPLELPQVEAPTLGIWSTGDIALTEQSMTGSAAFVDGPWRYERVEDAGHWLQLERPGEVNRLLLGFLAEVRATEPSGV